MYKGRRLSCVSTGIGTDNIEIVLAEILAITEQPTFIRIGSCGVLRDDIALGDLVITTGAVRLEATTNTSSTTAIPAVADYRRSPRSSRPRIDLGHTAHLGITATAPGFYGPRAGHRAAAGPLPGPRRRRWPGRA